MPVIDKAVSTEDLCAEEVPPALGVLRLDAILNTLVENKVEALKHEKGKNSSLHSSPKSILQKLKCHPSPNTTLMIENEKKREVKRKGKKDNCHGHKVVSESRQFKRQVLRQETSSPDSQILHADEKCPLSGHCRSPSCLEQECPSQSCCCSQGPMAMQLTDDYISIKMDGYGDIETDAIIVQEELRRARRKRRRRRKRRLKKRLALNRHLEDSLAHDTEFKALHDDELPPRAKWTIVATACLLLFMCLLLVGITLRMAPLIDEIESNRVRRAASLEEIYYKKKDKKGKNEQRRKSEFYFKNSDISIHRQKSHRFKNRNGRRNKSRRKSSIYDIEKGYNDISVVDHSRRFSASTNSRSSRKMSRQVPSQTSHYKNIRSKERNSIVKIILGVYFCLFCISILSVVVTLTHRTTTTIHDNNSTRNLTYYTFSPNPDVLYEDNR